MIDIGDGATWPSDLANTVADVAALVRDHPDFSPNAPAYELWRLLGRDDVELEATVRDLTSEPLVMYHATRLLPHEHRAMLSRGLLPLSEQLCSERLQAARTAYPTVLDDDDIALLQRCGPLNWDSDQQVRLNQIWFVAPIAALDDSGGFEGLFGEWGGEAISRSYETPGRDGERCGELIDELSERSAPAVIVLAVPAARLPPSTRIWPYLVATQLGLERNDGEWYVNDGHGLDVVEILTTSHPLWQQGWIQ